MKKQSNIGRNLALSSIFTLLIGFITLGGVYGYIWAGERDLDTILHKAPIIIGLIIFALSAVRLFYLMFTIPKATE